MIYLEKKLSLKLLLFFIIGGLSTNLYSENSNELSSVDVFIPAETRRPSCSDDCNLNICTSDQCSPSCSCDFFASSNDHQVCRTNCASSRTFFLPRSLTTYSALDLALGNYYFYHHTQCPEDRAFFQIQANYFHMRSTRKTELAAYFNPNARRTVCIQENGSGDVGSLWLDLESANGTSFSSTICLSPRRTVNGGFFNFYFDFNSWLCGSWLSIAFAAFRADHFMGIKESAVQNPGVNVIPGTSTVLTNATQALNNCTWTAGRISPCKLSRTGVDDVQFKLGWNYYFCNFDHLGLYFVATAPTGCRTRNQFLFEPLVGSRHGSVGIGFNGDYTLWDCDYQALHLMADLKYRFILSHCERRLFDLCNNGAWSRYLQVVTPENPSMPMPGVNFFAQNVDVKPRSTVDFWAALHYNYCEFNFEVGYDLFWREHEQIRLQCTDCLPVGIYDINGDCLGNPVSASCAQICQTVSGATTNTAAIAPSDATFTNVSASNFNLTSGSAPSALTHTIYGGLSYDSEIWCIPAMIGFVGGFEFARCNTSFQQWWVELRTAVAF